MISSQVSLTPQHPDQPLIEEANVSIDELISTFQIQMDHTSRPIVAVFTEGKETPLYVNYINEHEQSQIYSNVIACFEDNMENDY